VALDIERPYLGFVFALVVFTVMMLVSMGVSRAVWQFGLAYFFVILVSCIVFFSHRTGRRLRFTEDGIRVTRPEVWLEYRDIVEIHAPDGQRRTGRNFEIHLLHGHGYFTIPKSAKASSADLLDFLETQPLGSREIPAVAPILRDFLKQQLAIHGRDGVYVYRARTTPPPDVRLGCGWWPAAAIFVVGLGLAVLGPIKSEVGFLCTGLGATAVGGLTCLLIALRHKMTVPPIKGWQQAMLVIAPDGLALTQGTLTGELRWRELKNAKLGKGSAVSAAGGRTNAAVAGIHLQVAGASITIADLYHWPLSHALEQIHAHWRGAR
jgi:hypothetical protein